MLFAPRERRKVRSLKQMQQNSLENEQNKISGKQQVRKIKVSKSI